MASTNLETSRQRTPSSSNGVESRRPRLLTATETRRSFMTSEFWITIVMAVTLVVVGYANDDGLGIDRVGARRRNRRALHLEPRHREGRIQRSASRDLDDLT